MVTELIARGLPPPRLPIASGPCSIHSVPRDKVTCYLVSQNASDFWDKGLEKVSRRRRQRRVLSSVADLGAGTSLWKRINLSVSYRIR